MPTPPSERNLLFAVLALQLELAKPDDVLAAMNAWALTKHRTLGELLVERGVLADDHHRMLDALIDAQLARHGTAEQSLVALDPSSRVRGVLARVADPDVQASLAAVASTSEPDRTIDYKPESGPRYRVLRPHAEGGLGEVFVAEDQELHREVALKEIKREHAQRADSRSRFLLEAEITGGLEHPGIVPVYGLGTYGDGRPFYAMRFIKGDNLKAAIQRFHSAEPVREKGTVPICAKHPSGRSGKWGLSPFPSPRFDSLEFRQLLGRFVDVCQAVGYAHSRGVLHRDLKPGNIMLGKFGETLVVDWGLAKVVGRPGAEQCGGRDEATLRPSSGSNWAETIAGSAIGTPAFMSPEQASGKLDELGPATDVYSLGATLYALLTNRTPFEGAAGDVLEQVRKGAWIPSRAVNAAVPPALDAICRKAMALKPEDRYGSPLELAEEVEHWLADEPVGAYPEPARVQARRWMRKHPSRVTAAAVLLLATVVGLTIGAALLGRANRLLDEQRQLANENFQAAREAVDTYLTKVSEEKLLEEPKLQPLRKELLTLALDYYLKFINQRVNDPSVRKELADAYNRAGYVYQFTYTDEKVGSKRGKELRVKGAALYEELLREKPGDQELRVAMAKSLIDVAEIHWVEKEYQAALVSGSRAIDLWEQLRTAEPNNVEFKRSLGWSYAMRALSKRDTDDSEGQNTDIRRAVEIFQEMLKNAPNDEATMGRLATACRRATRLDLLLEGVRISRQLEKSEKKLETGSLFPALVNAGYTYTYVLGQPGKGVPLLQESVDLGREYKRQSPASNWAIFNFLAGVGNLGESLFLQGKTQPASRALKEAISSAEELKRRNFSQVTADNPWFRYILGCLEYETGNLTGGLDRCESAMRADEEFLAQNKAQEKENPGFVADNLTIRETIARFRFLAGKLSREEWLAQQHQISAERKSLHQRHPKVCKIEPDVGASAGVLAEVLLETGRADQALAVVEDVLLSLEKLVHDDKPDGSQSSDLDSRNYLIRRVWAELLARKGEALARTGKPAEAGKAVRQAVEITEDISKQEPCYLYDLARHLTLASTLPGSAGVNNPADRAKKALGEYIASGFDNPYKLRTDPRLEPLRKREDFQKLVRDLEVKVKQTKEP
ncbi:MAG: protein kinase domain-containing protein [Thermoguttaceae bacterium]